MTLAADEVTASLRQDSGDDLDVRLRALASWKWLSMEERLEALGPWRPAADAVGPASRVDYWKTVAEFRSEQSLGERLRAQGLSEALFRVLIQDAPPAGVPLVAVPAAHSALPTLLEAHRRVDRAADVMQRLPERLGTSLNFLRAVAPFLAVAEARLGEDVSETVRRGFLGFLAARLHALAVRALVLEVNLARIEDRLVGDSPEERFQSFLRDPGLLGTCTRDYPVLARLLAEQTDRAVEYARDLHRHLREDREALQARGLWRVEDGDLVEVQLGFSDPHRGSRTVALLHFASGRRLIYKPRSLAVEEGFQRMLEYVNRSGFSAPYQRIAVFSRDEHGYAEFVKSAACESQEEVRGFYYRQGGLVALSYLLCAVDLHSENIIAAGTNPILVDLECLFHPSLFSPENPDSAGARAGALMYQSVLASALLPTYLSAEEDSVEIGALGGRTEQFYLRPVLMEQRSGTDHVQFGTDRVKMPSNDNLPMLGGAVAQPMEHVPAIIEGFTEMYRLIERCRAELEAPDSVLSAFATLPVRQLLRPTWQYSVLLRDSTHPDFLRGGSGRDLAFERLWHDRRIPVLSRIVASEKRDLWRGDIPTFDTHPGTQHIWNSRHEELSSLRTRTALDEARRRLAEWGEEDFQRQSYFVRSSLAAMAANLDPSHGRHGVQARDHLPPEDLSRTPLEPSIFREQLMDEAIRIGDRLLVLAVRAPGQALWFGFLPIDAVRIRFGTSSPDLYSGVAGVALYLAVLGELTGLERFTRVARDALGLIPVPQAEEVRIPSARAGAFTGESSAAYTLSRLSGLLRDPALHEQAVELLRIAGQATSNEDDLLSGWAGAALVALRMARERDDARCRELAVTFGERMRTSLCPQGSLRSGLLAGLSHGAAGCAWAASELHVLTGDERFLALREQLLEYEHSLWLPSRGNWADLRMPGALAKEHAIATWCHGAPGIALGRLALLRHTRTPRLERELRAAVETTLREGWSENHSLCHGVLGNADILLSVGMEQGDAGLVTAANHWVSASLRAARESGWRCGSPMYVETPDLMTGLAGIGYALLRFAEPRRVPSVLALG